MLIWYLPINFFCNCLLSLTVIEMVGVLWEVELLNVKCNIILRWRIGTKSNHNWITFYWVHIYNSYGKNRNQTKLWQLSFPCTELRLTIVKRYLTYSQSFILLKRDCHWLMLGHVALTKYILCIPMVMPRIRQLYPAQDTTARDQSIVESNVHGRRRNNLYGLSEVVALTSVDGFFFQFWRMAVSF